MNAGLFHHTLLSIFRPIHLPSPVAGARDCTIPLIPAGSACQHPCAPAEPITDIVPVPAHCPYGFIRRTVPRCMQKPIYSASSTVHIIFLMSLLDMMFFPARADPACGRPLGVRGLESFIKQSAPSPCAFLFSSIFCPYHSDSRTMCMPVVRHRFVPAALFIMEPKLSPYRTSAHIADRHHAA